MSNSNFAHPNNAVMTIVAPFSDKEDLMRGLSELGLSDTEQIPKHWNWNEKVKLLPPDNQMCCGNCWAQASTNAFTDKILCMTHLDKEPVTGLRLNPLATTLCVTESNSKCLGGVPYYAAKWFEEYGAIASTDKDGNPIPGCPPPWETWCAESPTQGGCQGDGQAGTCAGISSELSCDQYTNCLTKKYFVEKGSVRTATVTDGNGNIDPMATIHNIKTSIMNTGPVVTAFWVMKDFSIPSKWPRSGIYSTSETNKIGGHGVEIVGWDETGDVPYWIVKNSWGPQWNTSNPAGNDGGYWYHAMYPRNSYCSLDVPMNINSGGGVVLFKAITTGLKGQLGGGDAGGSVDSGSTIGGISRHTWIIIAIVVGSLVGLMILIVIIKAIASKGSRKGNYK